MIPQETIEQVRQATDIVQIIGEFLRLRKRGRNFLALCPFHTEKTPSFNVSPDRQIYHCFGCGKGGNAFTFLIEHERMSFIEAVRFLAARANIVIKEEKRDDYRKEKLDRLNYANQVALDYFAATLKSARYRHIMQDYLIKKREISPENIEFFKLGLSGEDWDGLIQYATKKAVTLDDLTQVGLAIFSDKSKKYFDRFRQRLMIPIMNLTGKPIAFGGRTLKKGEPAKYINSPETDLYVKGNLLYGLNFSKDSIRDSKKVYIVEGYFDFISLWQAGIKNVVASSGTAFTAQQSRLLARFAEEVYLFFDADSAGKNAALRSVDALYDAGVEVKIISPPEGEDPDTVAKKFGKEKVDELTEKALGFIPFRIKDINLETTGIIGKEKLIKELGGIGSKISDPTRRELFFTEASEQLGVPTQLFQREQVASSPRGTAGTTLRKKYKPAELSLLSLLFNNPGTLDSIFEKITTDDFDSKELARLFATIMQQYKMEGVIDARRLIDNVQDSAFISLITEVAAIEWEKDKVESETRQIVIRLIEEKQKRVRQRLQHELSEAEAVGNHEKANSILEEIKKHGLDVKKSADRKPGAGGTPGTKI